ncbi:MAG: hypothetical protein S4CHLAM81_08380 [Chlamydiales bacterium]|nr:hypothetical protein [Chlamydiales bacterium]MCH9635620.1 hypothetical protein [Chlamydiales bacterium]
MRASKYIKLPLLLNLEEMEDLLKELGSFHIFEVGKVVEDIELSKSQFLERYKCYLSNLQGSHPFSLCMTTTLDAVEIIKVDSRALVKPKLPVVQLQPGRLRYSKESGDFQIGTFGEGISWGIQFSYPFLFQNDGGEIFKVDRGFPNTELFLSLQRWMRKKTKATPFLVEGKRINVPVRLGKNSFEWINSHPDLEEVRVDCV